MHYFLGYLHVLSSDKVIILISWCLSVLKVLETWNEHAAADLNDATLGHFSILWDTEVLVQPAQQPGIQQRMMQAELPRVLWLNDSYVSYPDELPEDHRDFAYGAAAIPLNTAEVQDARHFIAHICESSDEFVKILIALVQSLPKEKDKDEVLRVLMQEHQLLDKVDELFDLIAVDILLTCRRQPSLADFDNIIRPDLNALVRALLFKGAAMCLLAQVYKKQVMN
jgi:hypothetical protein